MNGTPYTVEGTYFPEVQEFPGITGGNHHEGWNRALEAAANNVDDGQVDPDDGTWFSVTLSARVKRRSPGWVSGYKVTLTQEGS